MIIEEIETSKYLAWTYLDRGSVKSSFRDKEIAIVKPISLQDEVATFKFIFKSTLSEVGVSEVPLYRSKSWEEQEANYWVFTNNKFISKEKTVSTEVIPDGNGYAMCKISVHVGKGEMRFWVNRILIGKVIGIKFTSKDLFFVMRGSGNWELNE